MRRRAGSANLERMSRVDYDRGAGAYRAGRTLPDDILGSWRVAVQAAAPRGGRVLDLGAGTGQFLGPLARWLDAQVVGVEPSTVLGPTLASPRESGRRSGRSREESGWATLSGSG